MTTVIIIAALVMLAGFVWELSPANRKKLANSAIKGVTEGTVTVAKFTKDITGGAFKFGTAMSAIVQLESQDTIDTIDRVMIERYTDTKGSAIKQGIINGKAASEYIGVNDLNEWSSKKIKAQKLVEDALAKLDS